MKLDVAPLAGAWIETLLLRYDDNAVKSRPSRARGLKQEKSCILHIISLVAPLAGAWIETGFGMLRVDDRLMSRPSRARGLKLVKAMSIE